MVVLRKSLRRPSKSATSSARKSSIPEESSIIPPDSSFLLTEPHDSIHSPFYLTSGDNPGISLISEVLDGSNYDNWSIAMTIALDAKNKLAFIDGSIVRPSESHRSFRIWSRCNSMVKSWILNSVSKQIYKRFLRFSDASEIWKDLLTRFHITNLPRLSTDLVFTTRINGFGNLFHHFGMNWKVQIVSKPVIVVIVARLLKIKPNMLR